MLGTVAGHDDIYIFIETQEELEKLRDETVHGIFIRGVTRGQIELKISTDLRQSASYEYIKNDEIIVGVNTQIENRVYNKLMTRGTVEEHLGYSHVNIKSPNESKKDWMYNGLKIQLERS